MNLLYLGPGLGGGALIIVIGVIVLVIITIFTFVWFPLKRFIKKLKK
jgi:hypothetical protein